MLGQLSVWLSGHSKNINIAIFLEIINVMNVKFCMRHFSLSFTDSYFFTDLDQCQLDRSKGQLIQDLVDAGVGGSKS